ncbi:MAG: outer membrane protein assembly factor BamE [Gammaproteobacteria bacterium]
MVALATFAAGFALQGCVYRMPIQQGNFLEERAVNQLQVGMTRSQVRYLLGTPMVPDAFDRDRWDYLYYLKNSRMQKLLDRHLIVYFHDDKVSKFDNLDARPMPPAEQRQIEPGTVSPAEPKQATIPLPSAG